ncbi:MAG: ATP-binding cassette domain-containing protein [Agromyces sp.]
MNTSSQTPTLHLEHISKHFAGVAALTDVNLTVMPGEIHALLGENGAGKSTLMNVASGVYRPDGGTVTINGESVTNLNPRLAADLGIAIVHQHPAILPDLTVEENIRVALPSSIVARGAAGNADVQRILASVDLQVSPRERAENLTVSQQALLEIAKAFALKPSVLILDEPTAPLDKDSSDLLFRLVRDIVTQGTSIVYITHRLAEVREIADNVTVLRDGKVRGNAKVSDISDDELLTMIIGRELESTFPAKATPSDDVILQARQLTGSGFSDVSFHASRGEIIGIAGVVGNGQSQLMKHLAGHGPMAGTVEVGGRALSRKELLNESAYLPADRIKEGLAMTLSVRENASISALKRFARFGFVRSKTERESVLEKLQELAVRAPSMSAAVSTLSGGNQQKVVMTRSLLAEPTIVIADEPTQGVDVGARSEIYRLLREISNAGVPVIVNSSDAKELEGLCDRVIVMSRGSAVRVLDGADITEAAIITSAVTAKTESVAALQSRNAAEARGRFSRFVSSDYAPSVLLVGVMVVLAAIILGRNANYLNAFNINSILALAAALGFIGIGQTIALLTGGIDLSVGPLAGLAVVVASFFINDGSPGWMIGLGFVLMLSVSLATGFVNGGFIRYLKFTAIAATLTTYIALQGFSFLLRDAPEGYINKAIMSAITFKLGPVPASFVVLTILVIVLEYRLRKSRWGWSLRAAGSNEESARRVGVNINRTIVLGYVATSFFAFLGAIVLLAQLGVGDPSQGVGYTLSSVTAVVLGGTSLLGGRGSFVGTLLGSVLLIQVMNAVVFLDLSQMWTYYFQGALILVAAIVYTVLRSRQRTAKE